MHIKKSRPATFSQPHRPGVNRSGLNDLDSFKKSPPPPERPRSVDFTGGILGGIGLGVPGAYGGLIAGVIYNPYAITHQYVTMGTVCGAVVGGALGVCLGISAARALYDHTHN